MTMSPNTTLSNAPAPPEIDIPLQTIESALLIGTFISLVLYGATLNQAYHYALIHWADHKSLKIYVAFVVLLDTVLSVLSMRVCYHELIEIYFNPEKALIVAQGDWNSLSTGILMAALIVTCQSFFAWRVYMISRRYRPLVTICLVLILGFVACTIATYVFIIKFPDHAFPQWLVSLTFGLSVLTDIVTTTILVKTLRESRTGIKSTDSILGVLTRYAICTGLATDIGSLFVLSFAIARPNSEIYVGFEFVTCHIYVNCVLAAINYRRPSTPTRWYREHQRTSQLTGQSDGSCSAIEFEHRWRQSGTSTGATTQDGMVIGVKLERGVTRPASPGASVPETVDLRDSQLK